MSVRGHFLTIRRHVVDSTVDRTRSPTLDALEGWSTRVADPHRGEVELTGALLRGSSDELLVALHGLGGSIESSYLGRAVSVARQAGVACLLLNARGADLSGEDFSHAGLTDDLTAALASAQVKRFSRVYLLGYSIGGHVALRYATRSPDPRVAGVVAVCSPLDLEAGMHAFDRLRSVIYRRHVLGALRRAYRAVATRGPVPATEREVSKVRRILEWDELIVARRFGYPSAWEYYQKESVAPRLHQLGVPALYVGAVLDPMVPLDTTKPILDAAPAGLDVALVERAGHLAFANDLDLGQSAEPGLESQCLAWLRTRP